MTRNELVIINLLIDKYTEKKSCGQLGEYETKIINNNGIVNLKEELKQIFESEELK